MGILTAGVNAAFEEMSGGNIAEHAMALFEDLTGSDNENPQLALEPSTAKSGAVAAMTPVAPAGQPGIIPQNAPSRVPAPTAILPPIKPSSITPTFPAIKHPPAGINVPASNLRSPLSAIDSGRPRLGAMRMPAAINAPLRNSIARFNGTPADAASRRISRSILEGQRAQAQLLLASLSDGKGRSVKGGQPGATPAHTVQQQQAQSATQQAIQATMQARTLIPARQAAHLNLPPAGAPAAWFQQAVDRALDKYQGAQSLKRASIELMEPQIPPFFK